MDRIIRLALSHRLATLAAGLLLAAYGLFVASRMPVDVFPDLNRPTVTVMTESPGMAPEEVETLVTLPLETHLNGIPGIERVRSTSGVGLSVIYAEFAWDTDLYRNRQLIAEKLQMARERMPRGVVPVIGPVASIMGEIQLVGLSSPTGEIPPMELRSLADWTLRPQLMAVPGVSQVIAIGGGLKQYQILLSAEKLILRQLAINDVEAALAKVSLNTTGSYLESGGREFLIRNLAATKSTDEILDTVIGHHLGRPVFVRDIAEVRVAPQKKRGDASINGEPAVILSILKQPGANTVELTDKIATRLSDLKNSLPAGVTLHSDLFKQATFIKRAVGNVTEALRDGTILVVIVIFMFLLNIRTTLITLTAIPLSILVTAVVFHFLGLSVNSMTLGGLAIAVGELVDDAIVDVENVFRRLAENRDRGDPLPVMQVVYGASSEIRSSIVFATVIVVLVFLPLFSLGGIEGRLFAPLGLAYIVALLASLAVSLTVTPVLCSFLLVNPHQRKHLDGWLVRHLKAADRRLLEFGLRNPALIISSALILFAGAIALIPRMGIDFLPKFNEGTATITLLAAPGIALPESDKLGRQAERLLLDIPEIRSVARRTGRAELDEHAEGVHYSEIDVDFHSVLPGRAGRKHSEVLTHMRERLATIPGVIFSIGQPISHRLDHLLSGVRAQIAIKVFGPDLRVLRAQAAEIKKAIEAIPGLVDLQIEQQVPIPQIKIQIMRPEAARFGMSAGEAAETLERALSGKVLGHILEGQRSYDLFMQFDETARATLESIQNTIIKVMPDGHKVLVADVADIYETEGPNQINRENAQRRIIISANTAGRDIDTVVRNMQSSINRSVTLSEGYFMEIGGQFESQQEATRMMLILGAISLCGVFVVLYAHFRSAFIALQIMLNIPLALIGSLVAIFITDRTLSVASMIAFVTLCGIASRNGIMMISHYLHLMKHEGEEFSRDMVIRGSLERLVPVLMTALTAVLGLMPLALAAGEPGKEILHPVAVVIVGGLISSTLLDMIVTPVVFFHFGQRSAARSLRPAAMLVLAGLIYFGSLTVGSPAAFAHEGHSKSPGVESAPNGGMIKGTAHHYIEVLHNKGALRIFIYDHDMKKLSISTVEITATARKPKVTKAAIVTLTPTGEELEGMLDWSDKSLHRQSIDLTVKSTIDGKQVTEKVSFNVEP